MASQVIPADKRFRMSLLLDAYGELLTEKQRTFLRHYYEEDLSFGEIAREYSVSRQAIFDSVKHGEEALNQFEAALHLVDNGWMRWIQLGLTPDQLVERLVAIRDALAPALSAAAHPGAAGLSGEPLPDEAAAGLPLGDLNELIEALGASPAEDLERA